ncbi:hypothetical protein [Clostridium paridis]|uniref:ATPase n=1 Tax=Clostridium paridis TaxID=2803863 RepID=A0A937FJN3_9CLOT|nr:hypothetical protein [Clostridium paridis]MBL4933573.1 hypothetical protein [Clostridium paridis]
MVANIINYYGGGNTARGQVNYYDSILSNIKDLYIVKNAPQIIKTSFIKSIAQAYLLREYEIELINSYMHNEYIEGVIIPEAQVAFVDGNPIYGSKIAQVNRGKEYIDLSGIMKESELVEKEREIEELKDKMKSEFKAAEHSFNEALKYYNKLKEIYMENLDIGKANKLAKSLVEEIYSDSCENKESKVYHRYFEAVTPEGTKDFIPNITRNLDKRYLIKGRPGTGKSTILKKILDEGMSRGMDLEVYHCGFDPESLDMVVIRELGVCAFDSTNPHEYYSERDSDVVIDTYNELITEGTDEKFKDIISKITDDYKARLDEGKTHLSEGKKYMLQIEAIYLRCLDKEKLRNLERGLGTLIDMYVR